MAERKPAKRGKQKSATSASGTGKGSMGFTEEERAAMREYVQERRAPPGKVEGESVVLAKIATMPAPERALGERLHAIIMASAPGLTPRLWYGMPAYSKEGSVVCFYQNAAKFKSRYGTLGFSDKAHLDEGAMWPTVYALKELSAADETRIAALVKKAIG